MTEKLSLESRRDFLLFLGGATLAGVLPGCGSLQKLIGSKPPFEALLPNSTDNLTTISGLNWKILIKENAMLNQQGLRFGMNNDFLAVFPTETPDTFVLVANHESIHPLIHYGNVTFSREKYWVDQEMTGVGVSLIAIKKDSDGLYQFVPDHPYNRRLDANTKIPLLSAQPIVGSRVARGTLANCSGGKTPWGTVLVCEENFSDYVGERLHGKRTILQTSKNQYQWFTHYDMPPEHYGWVVELEPLTGVARKHTALGRFAHEGATVTQAKDGRIVVYLGDDDNDRCLYKFISANATSLEKGTLYVAQIDQGRWLALDRNADPRLAKAFKDQTELLIYTREAAVIVGGSKLDRPEDIEVDSKGQVYVATTNNSSKNRPHGSLLKIVESGNDAGALTFESSTFLAGGKTTGFSCPDNMALDRNGNLWLTTDISGSKMGNEDYVYHGNNALFFIPLHGVWAGQPFRIASAPRDAEFTGPCFSIDGKTLFLSVQHPGEFSTSKSNLTSHWPNGGDQLPQSAVVMFSGSSMELLLGATFKD